MLISPLIVCTHATWSFITGKYARRQSVFVQNGLDYSNKSMEVGEMGMSDEERVLAGLKACYNQDCGKCPYFTYIYHCKKHLMQDAIAIIQELPMQHEVTE